MNIFGYFFQKCTFKALIERKGTSADNFEGANDYPSSPPKLN